MNNNINNVLNEVNNILDRNDDFARKDYRGVSDYVKLIASNLSAIFVINQFCINLLPIKDIYKAIINGILFVAMLGHIIYTCKVGAKEFKASQVRQENLLDASKLYNLISELIDKGDVDSINEIKRLSVKYAYSEVKVIITDMGVIDNKHRFQVIIDYDIYKNKILAYEQ